MRSSRFLLPFILGALTMLLAGAAIGLAAPGLLDRLLVVVRPGLALRGADATAVPVDSTAEVPLVLDRPAAVPTPRVPADAPPPPPPSGAAPSTLKLLIPVQGVRAESLVDTYEQARGSGRRHDAIDIIAPRGTPVVAVADGVVMKLFQSKLGGITLYELAPDRRTIYYYAHLDRYAPGMIEGRVLRRGDVLGYVGNTGDAGPGNYHLHLDRKSVV